MTVATEQPLPAILLTLLSEHGDLATQQYLLWAAAHTHPDDNATVVFQWLPPLRKLIPMLQVRSDP